MGVSALKLQNVKYTDTMRDLFLNLVGMNQV